MKKSVLIMLVALIVVGCAVLTSCQTKAQGPAVEYVNLGLEFKNKSEKTITGLYLYPTGSEELYQNIIPGFGMDGNLWTAGKVKVYPKGFIIRPVAESYEVKLVFEDGTEMIVPELDLLTPDSDGRLPNEISFKPDPNDVKIKFDDDADVQPAIEEAIAAGVTFDGWYPNV
ncbi:MAG: hypothetical protein J5768_05185 [Spirochaetales bacterium]|nr:hypothetical protein [Spirochaetales bacterium]